MRIENKPEIRADRTAILVVDMQNDFVSEGGKFVENNPAFYEAAQSAISRLERFLQSVSSLVPVVFTKTVYHPDHQDAGLLSLSRELKALLRGSWGAEIVEALTQSAGEGCYVIEKQRYNAFYNTNLELLLRNLGIQSVVVGGVATDICVESTARAARDLDLYPIVLSDCTAAYSDASHNASLDTLDRYFGSVRSSEEILPLLQGSAVL